MFGRELILLETFGERLKVITEFGALEAAL
jgi:hypothetical protein